jgi:hypothetical protein
MVQQVLTPDEGSAIAAAIRAGTEYSRWYCSDWVSATVSLLALVQCTDQDYVVKPTSPHFDLITATRAMLQQCPITRIAFHITLRGPKMTTPQHSPPGSMDWLYSISKWTTELNYIGPILRTVLSSLVSFNARFPGNFGHCGTKTRRYCMCQSSVHATLRTTARGKANLYYWAKRGKYELGTTPTPMLIGLASDRTGHV